MTKEQIIEMLVFWQKVLYLEEWSLKILWDEHTKSKNGPAPYATIWRSYTYDEAKITLSKDWVEWTIEEANRHLLHELLHCKFRDLDNTYDRITDFLDKTEDKILGQLYRDELESVLDKLCKILVESHLAGFRT